MLFGFGVVQFNSDVTLEMKIINTRKATKNFINGWLYFEVAKYNKGWYKCEEDFGEVIW